jgi:1,4-dihydroxy-2-naphthoate octaprenyltransferase
MTHQQPPAGDAITAGRISGWKALNPAVYLVSVLPGVGVALLAHQDIWWAGLVTATFAVVLLQHAINLFNDVSDWRLGADVEKHDSWVRAHAGDLRVATLHGALSAVAGILLGIATLVVADKLWILLVATPVVLLGYLYNAGERPLSYTSLGEWVTGLCYGPGVFGCLYLLAYGNIDLPGAIGMLTFGALAMALLLSHQPPQIETDRAAGKHSFAVRYGREMTVRAAWGLYLLALFSFALAAYLADQALVLGAFLACGGVVLLLSLPKTPNPRLFMLGANGVFSATLLIVFLSRAQ